MSDFDPSKYLTKVGNADYLPVKWRLVWLRQRHPDAAIDTQIIQQTGDSAVFKATVTLPGGGSATGYGSETMVDFRDYIEKAESKAIGRALAALGFGTQFAGELDDGERIADSPVDFASQRGRRLGNQGGATAPQASSDQTVTSKQLKFIQTIAREAGLDEAAVRRDVQESFGCAVEELGRREASEYIERLQVLRDQDAPVTRPEPPGRAEPPVGVAQDEMDLGDAILAGFFTSIEHAQTEKQLEAVGAEIKRSRLTPAERELLRDPFTRKLTAFQATT